MEAVGKIVNIPNEYGTHCTDEVGNEHINY